MLHEIRFLCDCRLTFMISIQQTRLKGQSIIKLWKEFVTWDKGKVASIREQCRRLQICPTTGCKWLERYRTDMEESFRDRLQRHFCSDLTGSCDGEGVQSHVKPFEIKPYGIRLAARGQGYLPMRNNSIVGNLISLPQLKD
jgi:hypothetical protein